MKRFLEAPVTRWRNLLFTLTLGISAHATAGVSAVKATNDASNAYYEYTFTGTPTLLQVFLDTDRNAASGLKISSLGANFLVENESLYKYTGSGTNWSWSRVSGVSMSKTATSVRFTVGRAALGSPSAIALVGSVSSPTSTSSVVVQTLVTEPSISPLQASNDSTSLMYKFSYAGSPTYFRIFLDTDRNASTGFSSNGVGANYLIENETLYRYSGSGGANWAWTAVKGSQYTNSNQVVQFKVLKSDLGSPSSLDLHAQMSAPTLNTSKITQSVSSVDPIPNPTPTPTPTTTTTLPPAPVPTPTPVPGSPVSVNYTSSSAAIVNPDRGFFWMTDCRANPQSVASLQNYRARDGQSVFHCMFYLRDFKNAPLSSAVLSQLSTQMDNVRTAGFKMILRFVYTSDDINDAPLSIVNQHLDQLKPLLTKNGDIISVVQAGIIGQWGEMQTSSNFGAPVNSASRKAVVDKLLSVVPADRMVAVRSPSYKRGTFGYGDSNLSSAEAFSGTSRARVSHYNDCFMSSSNDYGTYLSTAEKDSVAADSKYLGMSGETCASVSYNDCAPAMAELANLHWSLLHIGYNADVIAKWKAQGCFNTIQSKLGYRFVLKTGSYSGTAKIGGAVAVKIALENQGYASPFNPRQAELILRNTSTGALIKFPVNSDPRRWLPGSVINIDQTLSLPASMAPGNYALILNLPDVSTSLYARPEYSIQLANTGVWEASTGFNLLNHIITVSQ